MTYDDATAINFCLRWLGFFGACVRHAYDEWVNKRARALTLDWAPEHGRYTNGSLSAISVLLKPIIVCTGASPASFNVLRVEVPCI